MFTIEFFLFSLLTVAIIIAVCIYLLVPTDFRITRSAAIAAPPSDVFALVDDFHKWEAWSPWEKLDPGLRRTYEGAAAGPGAVYHWAGNPKVGEGRMTILESRAGELIRIKLEFLKPFKATNATLFEFKPDAGGTAVTWTMTGERNFVMKAFTLVMDMDKLVGADFEKGLAAMKAAAEPARA